MLEITISTEYWSLFIKMYCHYIRFAPMESKPKGGIIPTFDDMIQYPFNILILAVLSFIVGRMEQRIVFISFQLLNLLLWLRTTGEGSVPEMRIWSIFLIKSDLKWCLHLGRSLVLYCISYISVIAYSFEFRTSLGTSSLLMNMLIEQIWFESYADLLYDQIFRKKYRYISNNSRNISFCVFHNIFYK